MNPTNHTEIRSLSIPLFKISVTLLKAAVTTFAFFLIVLPLWKIAFIPSTFLAIYGLFKILMIFYMIFIPVGFFVDIAIIGWFAIKLLQIRKDITIKSKKLAKILKGRKK